MIYFILLLLCLSVNGAYKSLTVIENFGTVLCDDNGIILPDESNINIDGELNFITSNNQDIVVVTKEDIVMLNHAGEIQQRLEITGEPTDVTIEEDKLLVGVYNSGSHDGHIEYWLKSEGTWSKKQTLLHDALEFGKSISMSVNDTAFVSNDHSFSVIKFVESTGKWIVERDIKENSNSNIHKIGRGGITSHGSKIVVVSHDRGITIYKENLDKIWVEESTLNWASRSSSKDQYPLIVTEQTIMVGDAFGVADGAVPKSGLLVTFKKNSDGEWELLNLESKFPQTHNAMYGIDLSKKDNGEIVVLSSDITDIIVVSPDQVINEPVVEVPTCETSFDCSDGQYCSDGTKTCLFFPCEDHTDCYGLFPSGILPFCDGVSCLDIYKDTSKKKCTNPKSCSNRAKKAHRKAKGLMTTAKKIISKSASKITKSTIKKMKNLDKKMDRIITVKSKDVASFDYLTMEIVGQEAFLNALKEVKCKLYSDECDVSIVPQGNRRLLQSVEEVVVEIVYDLDDSAFNELDNDDYTDPAFIQEIADELGISPDNITVTGADGEVTIEVTLVEAGDGEVPVGDEIVEEIEELQSSLTNITEIVTETLNITEVELLDVDLVLCEETRNCNDRGTCNATTGFCSCETGYWGINCETYCNCENDGTCINGLCHCHYPWFGQRCENQKDCSC